MRKTLLRLLLVVVVLGVIGAAIGYRMWTKAPDQVEDKKGIAITATELCVQYAQSEQDANKKYLNQALEVTGTISSVATNQDGRQVVTMQSTDGTSEVQCTMRDKDAKAEQGKTVTIKGFCAGNTMFDVLLTDCIINKI